MDQSILSITPLGGLKQIGSNMILFETQKNGEPKSFLVDCGILFSHEDAFEIEYLFPDLNAISTTPEFIIITHGHEDHIGGIIHVLKKFPDIKIYCSEFTKLLIEKKLSKHTKNTPIIVFKYDDTLEIANIKIDQIHFNHSIPETRGILVSNKEIAVLYISDFKIDDEPQFEEKCDFDKLRMLSAKSSKRFLLADSTNITSKTTSTPSELSLVTTLKDKIAHRDGRVFVTFFASNIFRLKNILKISQELDKKVVLYGRSMLSSLQLGLNSGIIAEEAQVVINPQGEENFQYEDSRSVILLSGCQADLKSSFRRVAMGEDKKFVPKGTDIFIMSSKAIPGNEKKITAAINNIAELGAKVVLAETDHVHVSGHPGKEDLARLIKEFSPTDYLPIHGESVFLDYHARFAKSIMPSLNVYKIKNYDTFKINKNEVIIDKNNNPPQPIMYHGEKLVPLEKERLNERKKVARSGLVILAIKDQKNFSLKYLGICDTALGSKDSLEAILKRELPHVLSLLPNFEAVEKDLKTTIRKHFNQLIGQKPIVVIQLF